MDCRKDVRLPLQLQRAMAAEAEATRDARAKVLNQSGTPTNFQNYLFWMGFDTGIKTSISNLALQKFF